MGKSPHYQRNIGAANRFQVSLYDEIKINQVELIPFIIHSLILKNISLRPCLLHSMKKNMLNCDYPKIIYYFLSMNFLTQ